MTLRKPFPAWGAFLMTVIVGTLCWLGMWQVDRLHWKQDLLARMETEYARNPLDNPFDAEMMKRLTGEKPVLAYGSLRGQFHHDLEILVGPRTFEGAPGYHVITPFSIAGGGGRVLVNRGWVPLDLADPVKRLDNQPEGMVTLTGMARLPDHPNPFTPHNDPQNHTWYSVNAEEIGMTINMPGLPEVVFYAETQDPPPQGDYPVMMKTRTLPNNNHLQYALFWFGMAGILTLFFMCYLLWPQKER